MEGNLEDVDLVIAADQTLILIEAKAYGIFTDKQIASKVARLNLLYDFYTKLQSNAAQQIRFYFLLQGPTNPEHLTMRWPCWAANRKTEGWIQLDIPSSESILEVTRCDSKGQSSKDGMHWKVLQSRVRQRGS